MTRRQMVVTFCISMVFIGIIMTLLVRYNSVDEMEVTLIEEDVEIPTEEAKAEIKKYDVTMEYFRKYYIEITQEKGRFPFINEKRDTVKVEIWHQPR